MKELSPFRRWLSCGLQAALLIFPMAVSSSESVWPLEGGKYLVSGGANSVVIFDPSTVEYADEFVGHDSLMRYCTTDECDELPYPAKQSCRCRDAELRQ